MHFYCNIFDIRFRDRKYAKQRQSGTASDANRKHSR